MLSQRLNSSWRAEALPSETPAPRNGRVSSFLSRRTRSLPHPFRRIYPSNHGRALQTVLSVSGKDVAVNGNGRLTTMPLEKCKVVVFSSQSYMMPYFEPKFREACPDSKFIAAQLDKNTAPLANGYDVACIFVNDYCDREVLEILAEGGIKMVALRCAGYDGVDVHAANELGIRVTTVLNYSPTSLAEHAVALTTTLIRNIHLAYNRVWQGNYTLSGLEGMEIHGKTVGVIGTGPVGASFCAIMKGFGCTVLANALEPNPKCVKMGVEYVSLDDLLEKADIVSLHCPLNPTTFHIINRERLIKMKPTALLINVSRGGLVDTDALLDALEAGDVGGCGMDVYEKEGNLFFQDFTTNPATKRFDFWDRRFAALKVYPNVLITPHSAFLTSEAMENIASMTVKNIENFCKGAEIQDEIKA
ncbi:hypothetical protein BSKO_03177 [Bryopsis sp. KO-2023]|nr:hypothetical protein BSKO_03177 [Bryopsis sp. KO-2023]